jgi:hypothetical protein
MAWYDDDGIPVVGAGRISIAVGGAQPDRGWGPRSPENASAGDGIVTAALDVAGADLRLKV